jgi:hypothetical protein
MHTGNTPHDEQPDELGRLPVVAYPKADTTVSEIQELEDMAHDAGIFPERKWCTACQRYTPRRIAHGETGRWSICLSCEAKALKALTEEEL